MKKLFFAITLFVFIAINANYAQQKTQPTPQQPAQTQQQPNLKAVFYAGDIVFVVNSLATIEIKGDEVDAFLNIKNLLLNAVQEAQKEQKKNTDAIQIEMSVQQAQVMAGLMQRTKLTGANAESYKRVLDALVKAAKDAGYGSK